MTHPHASLVSESELLREWTEKVRSRVGSMLPGIKWYVVRDMIMTNRLKQWFENGLSPVQAAEKVVAIWKKVQP